MIARRALTDVDGRHQDRCRSLVEALAMDGAAVTARGSADDGHPMFATDHTARTVDDYQLTLGEGPVIEAFCVQNPISVPDVQDAEVVARWPALVPELTAVGVRGLFAFPLRIGAVSFGTVLLYRRSPGPLAPAGVALAVTACEEIARLLLRDLHRSTGRAVTPDVIALATGMVAVQAGVPVAEALSLLRAAAFAEEVSLPEVAAAVVARRRQFG